VSDIVDPPPCRRMGGDLLKTFIHLGRGRVSNKLVRLEGLDKIG